jgi:ABC-type microcin C transport system duplicated ATPase subunit YejF
MPKLPIPESPLVRVRGLGCHFDVSQPFLTRVLKGRGRRSLKAVDGVDLEIRRGETFSLVGRAVAASPRWRGWPSVCFVRLRAPSSSKASM